MMFSTALLVFFTTAISSLLTMVESEATDNPNTQESISSPLLGALVQRNRRRMLRPESLPCSRRILTLCEDTSLYYDKFMMGIMPGEPVISRQPSASNRRRSGVNMESILMNDEREGLEEPPEELFKPVSRRRKNRS